LAWPSVKAEAMNNFKIYKDDRLEIQERILKFVTRANWILFFIFSSLGFLLAAPDFAKGVLFGGLIVTINFHMLSKTLKNALTPPHLASHNMVLAKYYLRFLVSGIVLFILIAGHFVHPLGLFIGLSVVVASIVLATLYEVKRLIFKEAI
jgi:hypothetical protein